MDGAGGKGRQYRFMGSSAVWKVATFEVSHTPERAWERTWTFSWMSLFGKYRGRYVLRKQGWKYWKKSIYEQIGSHKIDLGNLQPSIARREWERESNVCLSIVTATIVIDLTLTISSHNLSRYIRERNSRNGNWGDGIWSYTKTSCSKCGKQWEQVCDRATYTKTRRVSRPEWLYTGRRWWHLILMTFLPSQDIHTHASSSHRSLNDLSEFSLYLLLLVQWK